MSYSEIGLAIVGIVLLLIISYVLLKPATPGKDCPSDEVFNKRCGQCAPKDCSPDNVDCDQGAKVAKCSCPPKQILCGGKCYPDLTIGCLNGTPYCKNNKDDKVCGTGSNTTCCQPNTTCSPDGTCGEGCKDPQICNNSQGNQCCTLPKQCLCVGGKGSIGQCKSPDTIDNNTCCSPKNTIMSQNSVSGTNECCPYPAANCDTDGVCTGINLDKTGKWLCCPGDYDPIRKKCAVACGVKDKIKTFCDPDTQYCMAITDTKGNTNYSCANNTCTWDSEITYPQIKNDGYTLTSDCMNPAVFVSNDSIDPQGPQGTAFSDRQNYVCASTWKTLPDSAKKMFKQGTRGSYNDKLRFFRAKSTMDNKGIALCNESDCHKKLSNYGDVEEMYIEKTGECWGSQTMTSFCGTNDSLIKLKNEVNSDPPTCGNLTNVPGFLNSSNSTIKGICPFPISSDGTTGGCTDFPAGPEFF